MAIHLTQGESMTLLQSQFPNQHHLPIQQEVDEFKFVVISGHYYSNQFQKKEINHLLPKKEFSEIVKQEYLDKEQLIQEAKDMTEWHFFLYKQKYHYLKVKEFVVLEATMRQTPFISYMMLVQAHPDTLVLFNNDYFFELVGMSEYHENMPYGQEHLMTRKGVYYFQRAFQEHHHLKWKPSSWKWQVDMSRVLLNL